jgi:hypothetical protein
LLHFVGRAALFAMPLRRNGILPAVDISGPRSKPRWSVENQSICAISTLEELGKSTSEREGGFDR